MKLLREPLNRILCLGIFVCWAASSPHYFSQTPLKNNSASISGRVTFAGKGIADVTVLATNTTAFDGRAIGQAQTDQDGNYRIEGLPAGSFKVVPRAQPYVLLKAEGPYEIRGQTVNLANAEAVDRVNFQLVRGAVITGRITDVDGDPVIGEQVAVTKTNEQYDMWLYETERYRTDDRGIYRIFGLEAGDYRVSVGQENPSAVNSVMARLGSLYTKTYYPGTTKQTEAKILEVKEGEELSNIDIVVSGLSRGFAISGRVLDNAGKPVANVSVGYSAIEGRPQRGSMNVITPPTDANGRFRAEGIPPGKYGAFTMGGPAQPGGLYSELSRFEVTDADVSGITIKLQPGATISGMAVIENNSDPAIFAALQAVQLFAASGNPEQPMVPSYSLSGIQTDGSFTFSGLAPGKVRIDIRRYPQPPKGFSLSRIELEGVAQESIEITAGADIRNVRLVFIYGAGSLRGRVKIEGGTLPEGTRLYVTLMPPGQRVVSVPYVEVDARGQFFADNIPPGTYELRTRITRARDNFSKLAPETQLVNIAHDVETDVTVVLNLTPEGERP